MPLNLPDTEHAKWRGLYDEVRRLDRGTVLRYEELDEHCDGDARRNRWVIQRTIRELEQQDSMTLVNVRGVGYRIASPAEHLTVGHQRRLRGKRQVHKAVQVLEATDMSQVDSPTRQAITTLATHMSYMELRLRGAEQAAERAESAVELERQARVIGERDSDERLARLEAVVERLQREDDR